MASGTHLVSGFIVHKVSKACSGLLFAACILVAVSCDQAIEQRPADVLDEPAMVKLLIRVHLAETFTVNTGYSLDSSMLFYGRYQEDVLRSLKLDTATVNRSMRYYSQHPDLTFKIYEQVVDSLSLRNETGNVRF